MWNKADIPLPRKNGNGNLSFPHPLCIMKTVWDTIWRGIISIMECRRKRLNQ